MWQAASAHYYSDSQSQNVLNATCAMSDCEMEEPQPYCGLCANTAATNLMNAFRSQKQFNLWLEIDIFGILAFSHINKHTSYKHSPSIVGMASKFDYWIYVCCRVNT